eukprot:jgi/Chrzof1/13043/Cz07g17220.t1
MCESFLQWHVASLVLGSIHTVVIWFYLLFEWFRWVPTIPRVISKKNCYNMFIQLVLVSIYIVQHLKCIDV